MKFLLDTIRLNLYDLNYRYGTPLFFERSILADPSGLPKKGLFYRIIAYLAHLIRAFKPASWRNELILPRHKVLLFATSKNQRDSLKSIQNDGDQMVLIGPYGDFSFDLTQFLAYFISLAFFPLTLYHFLTAEPVRRNSFFYIFDQYWLTYGYYIAALRLLRKLEPKAFILANDHNMEQRVINLAAKRERVPVLYIQHASVSDEFPPLSMDYALLDGMDAVSIYDRLGKSDTQVFLIGIAKADQFFEDINHRTGVLAVGICSNLFDPPERVSQLCEHLSLVFVPTIELIYRPHPHDQRKQQWLRMTEKYQMKFSDPLTENSFDFLKKVDVILAGNSNILLEAALMNIYPIYYDFAMDKRLEKYTFLRTGLCEYIDQPEQAQQRLGQLIKFKPPVRHKAKHYCVTIDTRYDGHSRELAQILINQIAAGNNVDLKDWQRVPGINLEAYEPCP